MDSPLPASLARSAAYTSAPARTASVSVGAPSGVTMNSWKSREFGACTPPLSTLKQGHGSRAGTPAGASDRHSGTPALIAAARAAAIDTPTTAFAPSRTFVAVPSNSTRAASTAARSANPRPTSAAAISPLT